MPETTFNPQNRPFDPDPRFVNHMVHWPAWAETFRRAQGDIGTLANMLGFALEEIDRLCKRAVKLDKARAALLFAYVATVETGTPVPLNEGDGSASLGEAFRSIQVLNEWRKTNKLNIKAGDA